MLVNIRSNDSLEYKPFMEVNDKQEAVRVMSYLFEKDVYMFRVDNGEETTFINRKEDLEYFLNKRVIDKTCIELKREILDIKENKNGKGKIK